MSAPEKALSRKSSAKKKAAGISPARKAAFRILVAIMRGNSHSDELLRAKAIDDLSSPDRHLTTALVMGVLRCQIRLDHQLRIHLKRPNAKLEAEVLIALRMGAFQILHMDRIPARAAIDESVELTQQAGHRFASGMVNAVLRKVASAPRPEFAEESVEQLALAQAHPAWLVERWTRFYGLDAARAICRHGQRQAAITLRITDAAARSELVVAREPGEFLTAACVLTGGDVFAAKEFLNGSIRIQDEGSQLVAEIAAANLGENGTRILDSCAAPGGKTMILAERCPDARIVACDASSSRLAQLRERVAAFNDRIECRHADAVTLVEEDAFDLVLADVPCTGTGTLGRNPEIRHRLRAEDLPRQVERQRAILTAALRAVRPGGRVVYSTCSLEPEENEEVVAAALSNISDARRIGIEASIDRLLTRGFVTDSGAERLKGAITPDGSLRLLPGVFATDGFFVCVIERTA
jgi:16S rRNA (cytosine967-C5)-methyltransferase